MNCEGVLVLGYPRTGTSVTTAALASLGLSPGTADTLKEPTDADEGGFWEQRPLSRLNAQVFEHLGGGRWFAPPELSPGWVGSSSLARDRKEARKQFARIFQASPWVWKDPRNCVLLPWWLEIIEQRPAIVLVTRHPLEAAASLEKIGEPATPLAVAAWERYMRLALAACQGLPVLVTRYGELVEDSLRWVDVAIAFLEGCGLPTTDDRAGLHDLVDPSLRHRSIDPSVANDELMSTSQVRLRETLDSLCGAHLHFQAPPLPPETEHTEWLIAESRRADIAIRSMRERVAKTLRAEPHGGDERREPLRSGDAARGAPGEDLAALESAIAKLAKQQGLINKRLARTAAQVESLVRLTVDPALWPQDAQYVLNYRRFGLLSQNGEEGVLAALLPRLGVPIRRFVEIGCGTNGGNSGLFAGELGWEGLMVDRSPKAVAACRARFGHNPRLQFTTIEITPENVDDVVLDAGLSGEVDYLSLDIDGFDYWVLEALEACRPRILVLEYNAYFGPDRSVAVPKDSDLATTPKWYFGASLPALTKLAARKGYRLLGCEQTGVNAFFLRNDLLPELTAVDARAGFRPIKRPLGFSGEGEPRSLERERGAATGLDLPLVEI